MLSPSNVEPKRIEALCPICSNLKPLVACVHCKQPLCIDCVSSHLDQWKESSIKFCEITKNDFEIYLKKLNLFKPVILKNRENVEIIKIEIEENFQNFLKKLIEQKEELFEQINAIQKENEKFLDFENKILNLNKSLEKCQDCLKKSDVNELSALALDFKEIKENVKSVSTEFSDLKSQPLKIIGEYEKPEDKHLNYFGNLIITESEPVQPNESKNKKNNLKENQQLLKSENDKTQMFGTLRIKLKRLVEQNDFKLIPKKPFEEHEISIQPKFIKRNSKNIFIGDQDGNLIVIELSKKFTIKSQIRLNVENIRDIAVSKNLIALSFVDLNQDQVEKLSRVYRNFDFRSGIFIYKISDFSFDKLISSSKSYKLSSPNGIGINENHLFICEKESHSLIKIDFKKLSLNNQLVTEGEPTSLDLGEKYLAYVDSQTMEINVVDLDKLSRLRCLKISLEFLNQSYHLVIRDKFYIAVKNRDDIRCVVYDFKLNIKYSFDYENSNSQGICNFQSNGNHYFLLGKKEIDKFKIGFFNDN